MRDTDKRGSRKTLFATNMLVFGLASTANKFVGMVVILLVANRFEPAAIGHIEIARTLGTLLAAVSLMGLNVALFRLGGVGRDRASGFPYTRTSITFVIGSSTLIAVSAILLRGPLSAVILGDDGLSTYVVLGSVLIISQNARSLGNLLFKMENNRSGIVVELCITSVVYLLAIAFLFYIVPPQPTAVLIAAIASDFSGALYSWVRNRDQIGLGFSTEHLGQLAQIGLPLMPSAVIFWVLGAFDRWALLSLAGAASAGVYSVAAKFASVGQVFKIAFSNGWSYFAYSTMDDADSGTVFGNVFEFVITAGLMLSVVASIAVRALIPILLPDEFALAAAAFPKLILGPVLMTASYVCSSNLTIYKRTRPILFALLVAGATNVVGNLLLIPSLGLFGAALATAASNLMNLAILYTVCQRTSPIAVSAVRVAVSVLAYFGFASVVGLIPELSMGAYLLVAAPVIVVVALGGREALFVAVAYITKGLVGRGKS